MIPSHVVECLKSSDPTVYTYLTGKMNNTLFYLSLTIWRAADSVVGSLDWGGAHYFQRLVTFGITIFGHYFLKLESRVATFRGSLLLEVHGKIARHN